MTTCKKRYDDIPFAHRQFRHDGHCANIHGHNWAFEFEFASESRDVNNFVVDFGKLKFIKEFLGKFDHALVLIDGDPMLPVLRELLRTHGVDNLIVLKDGSAEGLAEYVHLEVGNMLSDRFGERVWLNSVTVYEDGRNSAFYSFPGKFGIAPGQRTGQGV